MSVKLEKLSKSYGDVPVIHGVDLTIEQGEFVVFVGPSGCGKSTLLRMIAGLEKITEGTLSIDGETVNDKPPSQRGIAMVFQSYALYPHLTVFENMAFSLRIAKQSKEQINQAVRSAAAILQLEPFLERLPKALSGGQRQRVAIGRAIVRNPKVFLFDEPLSNLDAALRVATRIEIANLKESMPGTTMIYVTHDQVEAMTLANRIVVLSQGNVEQVGTPLQLYESPANLFVASFIGTPAMNIIDASVTSGDGQRTALLPGDNKLVVGKTVFADNAAVAAQIGIRPEDMFLASEQEPGIRGSVLLIETLGEYSLIYVELPGAQRGQTVIAKVAGVARLSKGDPVRLSADENKIHVFDADGKAMTSKRAP